MYLIVYLVYIVYPLFIWMLNLSPEDKKIKSQSTMKKFSYICKTKLNDTLLLNYHNNNYLYSHETY
jgi:hypothetical protein